MWQVESISVSWILPLLFSSFVQLAVYLSGSLSVKVQASFLPGKLNQNLRSGLPAHCFWGSVSSGAGRGQVRQTFLRDRQFIKTSIW